MAAGGWLLPTDSDLPAGTVPKSEPAFEVLILRVLRTEQCQKNGGVGTCQSEIQKRHPCLPSTYSFQLHIQLLSCALPSSTHFMGRTGPAPRVMPAYKQVSTLIH